MMIQVLPRLNFVFKPTEQCNYCIIKLNKNTLGVKKVRGQSEAALQIGMYDQKR